MSLLINQWEIFEQENRIAFAGNEVFLQPLCMSLLLFLSQRAGVIIERKEIIEQVWQGRVVSEDALNNSIRKLRKALGDDPKAPRMIETINKKGYRLIAKVSEPSTTKTPHKPKRWLSLALAVSLIFALKQWLPLDVEVIQISSDMSEQEKQSRYDRVKTKTLNGGHIVKLSMGK